MIIVYFGLKYKNNKTSKNTNINITKQDQQINLKTVSKVNNNEIHFNQIVGYNNENSQQESGEGMYYQYIFNSLVYCI